MIKFRAVAAAALVGAMVFGSALSATAEPVGRDTAFVDTVAVDAIPLEVEVSAQNWEQIKGWSNERPVMIMYTAVWCHYCQILKPKLRRMVNADGGKWTLALLDVDRNRPLVPGNVRGFPTIAALKSGQVGSFLEGPEGESDIRPWIERNLVG